MRSETTFILLFKCSDRRIRLPATAKQQNTTLRSHQAFHHVCNNNISESLGMPPPVSSG